LGNPDFWYTLGAVGLMINLVNLLPMRPLDGGRILGIVSHWATVPGILVGGFFWISPIFYDPWEMPSFLWTLLMFFGITEFFIARKKAKTTDFLSRTPKRQRAGMTVVYMVLVLILAGMTYLGLPLLNNMKNIEVIDATGPSDQEVTLLIATSDQ